MRFEARRLKLGVLAMALGLGLPSAGRALTCDWTGAASSAWHDPANWTNCGGGIPGAADTASITNVANQPIVSTVTPVGGLSLGTGATLAIDLGGNLHLDGNVSGTGHLLVVGTLTWLGGTMGGSGSTTIGQTGSLTLTGPQSRTLGRDLVNEGMAIAGGPDFLFVIGAGATFTNQGLYEIQNGSDISGPGEFHNLGTFVVSGTAVGVAVADWLNTGIVHVMTGSLSFTSASASHGGNYTFVGTSLRFTNGSHTVTGSFHGATLELNTPVDFLPPSFLQSVEQIEVRSAVSFNSSGALIPNTLLLDGATITGDDDIFVNQTGTWVSGVLSGTGGFIVALPATLTMSGPGPRVLDRNMSNIGLTRLTGTSGTLVIPPNRTLTNGGNGTFLIENDSTLDGGGEFRNFGIFRRTSSPGNSNVNLSFVNEETVRLESGGTYFQDYVQTSGSTTLAGGSLGTGVQPLEFQAGTLEGSGSIDGDVVLYGIATIAPGDSPGQIEIFGNYRQSQPAHYTVELAGTGPGQADRILCASAALGGVLGVSISFPPSVGDEFHVMSYEGRVGKFSQVFLPAPPVGLSWLTRYGATELSLRLQAMLPFEPFRVDEQPSLGSSNENGILEPGESVLVDPAWINPTAGPIGATGMALGFTGPPGASYTIEDATADYGTIPPGAGINCIDATGNCYALSVDDPPVRPAAHWDATFDETLSNSDVATHTLHIGESFSDISPLDPFYPFIETLFHNQVTGGCGNASYCAAEPVTRAQVAVFLLVAGFGASYRPFDATGAVFDDVPAGSFAAAYIETLSGFGITAGCGGLNYCPNDLVTREQMAVLLLRTLEGIFYTPPACTTPTFTDVPCASPFARWIEELVLRGITGGCGPGIYCPTDPVTRGQMAVFLTVTFSLPLNGA